MTLNGAQLGAEIAAAVTPLKAAVDPFSEISQAEIDAIETARANAVINHFIANGVTSTTVTGGSSAGTYPGTIS